MPLALFVTVRYSRFSRLTLTPEKCLRYHFWLPLHKNKVIFITIRTDFSSSILISKWIYQYLSIFTIRTIFVRVFPPLKRSCLWSTYHFVNSIKMFFQSSYLYGELFPCYLFPTYKIIRIRLRFQIYNFKFKIHVRSYYL